MAGVWGCRCTGSRLPCSSLKHRERLAASISGVGLSRTCLHHCKGLRDFSDDGNVFEEPTYNLKKRNLHYRDYIASQRLPLLYLRKQHVFNSFYQNRTHIWLLQTPESFLTDKYPLVEYDTFCSLVARRTSKNYGTMSQRVGDLGLWLLNWPGALWWSDQITYISRSEHFHLSLTTESHVNLG